MLSGKNKNKTKAPRPSAVKPSGSKTANSDMHSNRQFWGKKHKTKQKEKKKKQKQIFFFPLK